MNRPQESIIMNSCEYTPIYLIPSTSVTQAGSYIITPSNQEIQKPVADNLKTFYENSGKLESGILSSPKPRILKKQNLSVGNNLKVASFFLPKSENNVNIQNITPITKLSSIHTNKIISPVTNVIVKAAIPATSVVTAVEKPKKSNNIIYEPFEVDRKIVRVGTIPNTTKTQYARVLPKFKPKEGIDFQSKHTSVQLIKLGETYHSLNQLSESQMKIVNKALKMFSDPEKIPQEAAYDPSTNTKFIYKVVSPKDLTVVGGKNKVVMKKKTDSKRQKNVSTNNSATVVDEEPEVAVEPKVTRSGRTVKLPKQMRPGVSPQKPKKKIGSVVNCFQCSAEFCSFYRLQRHYEMYPTHIPARIHTNMFHCLLAIIKGGSEDDQANIFIQQIEHLIEKIKSLWPCLLTKMEGKESKLCTINEEIGRLFGLSPGKYNINVDALNCVKDKDGHCVHNPSPKYNFTSDTIKTLQTTTLNQNEEIIKNDSDTEDCARINSVDKWPTVNKRIWKQKRQKRSLLNAKKMRLTSENEQQIEPGMDDVLTFAKVENSAITIEKRDVIENGECEKGEDQEVIDDKSSPSDVECVVETPIKAQGQFHSTHFDIRSSPIKLPSSLVRKFQLNPSKISNPEVQILQPLDQTNTENQSQPNCDLEEVYSDNVHLSKATTNDEVNFSSPKDWSIPPNEESSVNFMKADILFDTGLTPVKSSNMIEPSLLHVNEEENYLLETPNKKSDFQADNIMHINNATNGFIEPVASHENDKSNHFFGSHQQIMVEKEESNAFCESSSILVKPKFNTLIGSSVINLKALTHVKERSNNLFGSSLLQPSTKPNNDGDSSLINSLFDTSLLEMKDKELLDSSLLQDDNSSLFTSKGNNLIGQTLLDDKSNDFQESMLDTNKNDLQNPVDIDVNQSDNLSANDSRLLSNQGQSVLNFLDSLGNESLGLAYPETEIRSNVVDFQLDLFYE